MRVEGTELMPEHSQSFEPCPHVAIPPPRLRFERVVDAPRERVFEAWTEPQQMMRWWAPSGFSATFCAIDLRPHGRWSICMQAPDGSEQWTHGVYQQVCAPETLVLSLTWQEESMTTPLETMVSLTFAEEAGKTRFIFEQTILEAA
jgi:uncharacterized protein YndB with AHSA1/START domain